MNSAINQELTLLRDFLDRENELGILIGSHQNTDTYAAALSLFLALTQSGKKVQIVSKKAPTVEVSNLVAIDKVKENFAAGSNSKLVVALPYIKGEVEKVLFTEAPNTINFHLTAAPDRSITPFELSDVKLMWEGGAPVALITIGVSTTDEIMGIADPSTSKIVNIDNFSGNTRCGDVVLVDDSFSSLSEVSGKIIKDLNLPMDIDIAQNILDGVMYSTRNFTKGNTSPLAFEAVSAAMYQGAQRKNEEVRREQGGQGRPSDRQANMGRGQQRVSETDFPAMHMQGRAQQGPQRAPQQRNPMQQPRQQGQNRPQQQRQQQPPRFGQNTQDIDDLMQKINEENVRQGGQQFDRTRQQEKPFREPVVQEEIKSQYEENPRIQDAQVVADDMSVNQPIEDANMPQEQPFAPQSNEDIPDDWLMPKVFKSSKNNN